MRYYILPLVLLLSGLVVAAYATTINPGVGASIRSTDPFNYLEVQFESTSDTERYAFGQWVYATGGITRKLPPVGDVGQSYCLYSSDALVKNIDPQDADLIVLNGTPGTIGVTIKSSGAVGDYMCLFSNGTEWHSLGQAGGWLVGL